MRMAGGGGGPGGGGGEAQSSELESIVACPRGSISLAEVGGVGRPDKELTLPRLLGEAVGVTGGGGRVSSSKFHSPSGDIAGAGRS